MSKVDKEATIRAILAKRSPFMSIDEEKLRAKAYKTGGVTFLRNAAKYTRARVVMKA